MTRPDKLSILVLDDQEFVLEAFQRELMGRRGHTVETTSMPGDALRLAREHLFDIVVVDAKLPYKGAMFGGISLAEDLAARYGQESILLISQVIDSRVFVQDNRRCRSLENHPTRYTNGSQDRSRENSKR